MGWRSAHCWRCSWARLRSVAGSPRSSPRSGRRSGDGCPESRGRGASRPDNRQRGRVLVALLLFQMVGMSLSSVLFAAHPPVILAVFMATAIPTLVIGVLNAESFRLLPLLIWSGVIFLTLCLGYLFNPLSADPAARV